jgi:S-DNA-T family DNA segregation ATPase FtsK/SpoIIIE
VRRWAAAGPAPVPAAPIGATAEGPLVVDWAGDGPHALLAGTTGAGKSELLRSLVASLAASVDPEHLNFVLIDYKGGSAFDACAGLPHTVGMVTDLDGHLAQRALTCLEAELRWREETLRLVAADDIAEYQESRAEEPLPRLLVVIDEFAALARELPDFMAALVDIAQRGRSLGVHLLLATQRPNGIINDNIRANTNLRISLRVQDVADSMDVLGTPEAAGLSRSRPGRGFLRRGPGDVVAFQSALVTDRSHGTPSAVSVSPFLPAGERSSAAGVSGDASGGPSDLEELVTAVTEAAAKAGMRQPRLPWPEPLPAGLQLAELDADAGAGRTGRAPIGLVDEPHRQRRGLYSWATDGNLFIYGVQGSGTSSALITAVAAACRVEAPARLHVYLLDFDDQRLGSLEELPHVGAVIGAGERERQVRLLRYLQREVAERRELTSASSTSLEGKPRIVVGLDNFAGFRAAFEDPADLAIKESLGRIVADGPGVGVVVVATAKQPVDIPSQVASLVAAKLVMRLADRYEYTGLGVTVADPPETPGRAFEAGTSLEIQLALASTGDIAELARPIEATAQDQAPWAIELLPTEIKIPDIVAGAEAYDLEWRVPVAVGDDSLSPIAWTLRDGDHVLISGPARSGKSTTLATIATVLRTARHDMHITALTPRRSPLADCAAIDTLVSDTEELLQTPSGSGADQLHAILIDDAEDVEDSAGALAGLIADRHPHCHVFAAGVGEVLRSAYGHWTQAVRRSRLGLALNPNPATDGDLWQTTLPRRGPAFFPAGRGYFVVAGTTELCQVAWQ